MVPAPRGPGIVAAHVPKKVLQFARASRTSSLVARLHQDPRQLRQGHLPNCLMKTYGFLTPDFWRETRFIKTPFQEYTDLLARPKGLVIEAPAEKIEA
ncbi:hypothetical protein OsJ_23507 [Oryza sativa Japonica Group]|uniref:Uncharacterized protein n=1 Tax=Oryza sativa subsp. japonica TaxID=39947 RepID=B9FW42_ORYSJ|nr:hypothetical protein OsJ_23507 [Oryza sativa Japonica Group]